VPTCLPAGMYTEPPPKKTGKNAEPILDCVTCDLIIHSSRVQKN
jgi:ferredoxin-like protein FixX